MGLNTILSSAVIAAIFSGVVSYIVAKRDGNLKHITAERKEWREKIRDIASRLNGATYEETISALTELKVRINSFAFKDKKGDYSLDSHIWEIIEEIEFNNFSKKILELKQERLVMYLSLLLKSDWERSKEEVKGNIFYLISGLAFGITGIYPFVCIYILNAKEQVKAYELISKFAFIGIFIIIFAFITGYVISLIKTTCICILGSVSNNKTKRYKTGHIIACYFIWGLGVLGLAYIFITILKEIFIIIGGLDSNLINISFIYMCYSLGIGLQAIPKAVLIRREFYYYTAIENICNKYTKKELEIKIISVISQIDEKFKSIYEDMDNKHSVEEFRRKFIEKYPTEWDKIKIQLSNKYKYYKTVNKKEKEYYILTPEQCIDNIYYNGVNPLRNENKKCKDKIFVSWGLHS